MLNQPLTYEDFVVEATDLKKDGSFWGRVLSSPLGGMTSASAVRVNCNWDKLASLVAELQDGGSFREMMEFGRQLTDLLLPEGASKSRARLVTLRGNIRESRLIRLDKPERKVAGWYKAAPQKVKSKQKKPKNRVNYH